MKDEAATILPAVAFAVTVILAARVIILFNLRTSRAAKRLKEAYTIAGKDWSHLSDFTFRRQLFLNPDSIREESDSLDVREAKEGLIACRAELAPSIWSAIKIVLWGFAGIILLSVTESAIRHFT
jgi:hypothetical protein